MIFVHFLGNNYKIFENEKEAIDAINHENIHPDLLKIFKGDFKEITYQDLLKNHNNFELDKEKIKQEMETIQTNLYNNLLNNINKNFLLSSRIYYYGSVKEHTKLNIGFNPLIVFSINLDTIKNILSAKKIKKIVDNSLINEWKLVRIQKGNALLEPFISGNNPVSSYSVFITKSKDKLAK